MNDVAIQDRSSFLSMFYRNRDTESAGNFGDLMASLSKSTDTSGKAAESETTTGSCRTTRTTRSANAATGRSQSTANTATSTSATETQTDSSTESGDEVDKSAYVFRPGFFEALQQQVQDEIAAGRDPEVTLDGSWRNYDSVGNELPEPIPLNISGGWEYDKTSSKWEWSGGENPYDLYWLDGNTQDVAAGDTTDASGTTTETGETGETSTERGRIAWDKDSPYKFRPQYFESLIQQIAAEKAMGRDPAKTIGSYALSFDSCGNELPEPIPLDISGGFTWNGETKDFEWTGGKDPYTLYWLSDDQIAQAKADQLTAKNTAVA